MQAGTAEEVRRSWWVSVVFGLIGIAFGLLTLAKPFQALVAMAWAFGILALADGIASLLALFDKRVAIPKSWLLLYAVASIAFGVIAVANPKATAGILFLLLSFWLIVAGVFRIVFAIRVRKEIVGEWLIALSGVLAIVLGVLFLRNPAIGLLTTAIWIGAGALAYGVLQVFAGFRFRKHKPLEA
ncbi:HdeD family acid-resistance protein [Pseudoxanthomonas suwonensis]|uniref:Membrane protein n=1 Tax=Pseudoxanthomonas suwonensis TaxID=314722 RepID=A0A0E3Z1J9_9GAMM|nr:HdeD family acid-resistance protein [Pseudoxanthomonas suwonensis]AKC86812.1 membrane protein [Pseudoxanthomonas suwonensis]